MRNVKLVTGFQGTRYEGWQSQRTKGNTLQEIIEQALERILKERVDLVSSSRTDSGVHALAMPAHFRTKSTLADPKLKAALNHYLPHDIVVSSAKTVKDSFHARYHAKSKLYRYSIWNSRTRPLFEAPYVLWYTGKLDVAKMRRAARHLVGRHDFTAFWDRAGDEPKGTVRTVKRIAVTAKKPLIRIEVEGDGFLRHMVRVIAGTLIEVGRGKMKPDAIPGILNSKNRKQAGPTAKAMGLTLIKVKY